MMLEQVDRPWGYYKVLLDEPYCKVKEIMVKSGHRLSYQSHQRREELWTVVQGKATTVIEDVMSHHPEGSVIHIPKKARHRVQNNESGELKLIEIQRGDYFGEDDITRFEDDYNRV